MHRSHRGSNCCRGLLARQSSSTYCAAATTASSSSLSRCCIRTTKTTRPTTTLTLRLPAYIMVLSSLLLMRPATVKSFHLTAITTFTAMSSRSSKSTRYYDNDYIRVRDSNTALSHASQSLLEVDEYEPAVPLYLPCYQDTSGSSSSSNSGGGGGDDDDGRTRRSIPIRTVAAPMVASSDYAFRCLMRQYSADLTFTQMLHARNLIQDETFYRNHWDLYEYESDCGGTTTDDPQQRQQQHAQQRQRTLLLPAQLNLLEGGRERERGEQHCAAAAAAAAKNSSRNSNPPCAAAARGPVIAQLAGNDVDLVVRAAELLVQSTQKGLVGIDFNLGCPQGIARKGNYGAFFMEDDEATVYQILAKLRQTLPPSVAVSAKIRLPLNPKHQADRTRRLCDTGIDFLTVHGRDLTENKATVSAVHVDRMAAAVETANLHAGIPVIVNGGIETAADVTNMLYATGAAAVMSSEALLERPTLFLKTGHGNAAAMTLPQARFEEQWQSAATYLQWCRYAPPVPGVLGVKGGSFNIVRGHLFKILYRYLAQDHVDLRDALANHFTCQRLEQAESLLQTLKERYRHLTDAEWEALPSSVGYPGTTWYRRHWAAATASTATTATVHHHHHQRSKWNPATGSEQHVTTPAQSVDERKQQMRERIAKLRSHKEDAATATTKLEYLNSS